MSREHHRRSLGFTLAELLIVIAVISILATSLFPVFGRARENSRRARCQSNLQQIGLCIAQYSQDYDEKFPVQNGGPEPIPTVTNGVWVLLQPYVKSEQIYQCPSEKYGAGTLEAAPWFYTDYVYNRHLGFDEETSTFRGLALTSLTHSALTVVACEGTAGYPNEATGGCPNNTYSCAAGKAVFYQISRAGSAQRHLDTQNFLFADGHVKACKGQDSITSAEVWNYFTPGSMSGTSPTFNTTP